MYLLIPLNRRQEHMPFGRVQHEGPFKRAVAYARRWQHWAVYEVVDGENVLKAVSPRDGRLRRVDQ